MNSKVFKVSSTRVWRTYFGGKELEKWQGKENPADGELPEEWIASVVRARNPGREHIQDEGLSKVTLETGENITLKELIERDPAGFLGADHVRRCGSSMGILAKVIDSMNRLTIQVHPDKEFAKNVFSSDYGKTESWYILGGRKVNGEDPHIYFGFKPGITRERWKALFDSQDIQGMLDSLHKIYVKPGETYFIDGGLPHAIGSGCFVVELQEPTDYTIRVERRTPEGKAIPDSMIDQGIGFDKIFDCFHYDGYTREALLEKWRIKPQKVFEQGGTSEYILIGESCTRLFGMNRIQTDSSYESNCGDAFSLAVVVSGRGTLEYQGGELEIRQGDFLFIPAAVKTAVWRAERGQTLQAITFFPPA